MIICNLAEPVAYDGWKAVCRLERCVSIPDENLKLDHSADWAEALIERTLVKYPEVLAQALGIALPQRLLILRQVSEIDLYLRTEKDLHLVELKRPAEHRQWKRVEPDREAMG